MKKRWLDVFQIAFCFTQDMTCDKFRRIFEHVDEAVQFAQDVVGQVAAGLGLAVQVDRHISIFPAHFLYELAQVQHRGIKVRPWAEFLIVDGQDKRTRTRLLLSKLRQVAISGHPDDFKSLVFYGLRHRADAKA